MRAVLGHTPSTTALHRTGRCNGSTITELMATGGGVTATMFEMLLLLVRYCEMCCVCAEHGQA